MGTHQDDDPLLLDDPLLQSGSRGECKGAGSVDVKGNPVRHNIGNWRACSLYPLSPYIRNQITGTECCERLAYYGIATNLE
ncbi:hypothetical protein MKX01_038066, partial [Papaver californicum]